MYHKNRVFAAACLGMLLFGVVFLSLGSVNNMLAERFGLDDTAIGTLTALLPFGILVGSLLFGPIVDRFGYRWMLVAASLIVGGSLEGMALTENQRVVQLCVFAIGFGGGILNGATNALVADVSEGERGAKLSLLGVFFGIGALAMPASLAALAHRFPLDGIVAGIGGLSLLPAAYCLTIAFPAPKLNAERLSVRRFTGMLGDPFLLLACAALAIQSGMEGLSNDWMTRYFKKIVFAELSSSERTMQLSLVALTGSMMVTRLVLAGVMRHVGPRAVLLASLLTTLLGALWLVATPASPGVALVGPLFVGVGLAATFPIVLGFVGDRYPQQSGTAFSTIFVFALAGNMAVNKSFGYIAQQYGVRQFPYVLIALVAFSAVALHLVYQLRTQPTLPEET